MTSSATRPSCRPTGERLSIWRILTVVAFLALPHPRVTAVTAARGQDVAIPVWEVAYGGFRQLEDVAVTESGEAWGIDAMLLGAPPRAQPITALVHRENGVWRVRQVVEGVRLASIAMASSQFGLAVGDGGAILRYDGLRWWPMASPTKLNLVAVALCSATEGWAVGELGTLLRWDGREWTVLEAPALFAPFIGVAAPRAGEAWAATTLGQVFHYQDGRWQTEALEPLPRVAGLAFASERRGMVYGYGALEYRDGRWSKVADESMVFASLAWWGDTAYAVVASRLVAYRDGRWQPVEAVMAEGYSLNELTFLSVARADGGVWAMADNGVIVLLGDGAPAHAWPAATNLQAIDFTASGKGWAGGTAFRSAFVGQDVGSWGLTVTNTLGATVLDLDLVGEADGWAIGIMGGEPGRELPALWRYDGVGWRNAGIDKTWRMTDVEALAPDDVWMAGRDLVATYDGVEWQLLTDVPFANGTGVLALVAGEEREAWFGGTGQLFHLKGSEWITETLPSAEPILHLDALTGDDVWAASSGRLYHYDGLGWSESPVPLQAGEAIRDLAVPRRNEPWLLLDPPGLLQHTVLGWRRYPLTALGYILPRRMHVRPLGEPDEATEVWLAGDQPSIIRLRLVAPVSQLYLPGLYLNAAR